MNSWEMSLSPLLKLFQRTNTMEPGRAAPNLTCTWSWQCVSGPYWSKRVWLLCVLATRVSLCHDSSDEVAPASIHATGRIASPPFQWPESVRSIVSARRRHGCPTPTHIVFDGSPRSISGHTHVCRVQPVYETAHGFLPSSRSLMSSKDFTSSLGMPPGSFS